MKLTFSWKKHLKTFASLAIGMGALFTVVGQGEAALGANFVRTNGKCLNVRTGPSTYYSVIGCVRNGVALKPIIRYRNGFAQLSSGNWLAARWISSRPGVRRPVSPGLGVGGAYLRRGSRGRAVSAVQSALGIRRDGVYGSQTERAVRRFQARYGLLVDGVVGPQTRRELRRWIGS